MFFPFRHKTSVTRWLDYFSTFGHLLERKFAQWDTKFAKVVPNILPNSKYPPPKKNRPILYRVCQTGVTLPNLVTLHNTLCQIDETIHDNTLGRLVRSSFLPFYLVGSPECGPVPFSASFSFISVLSDQFLRWGLQRGRRNRG